MIDEYSSKFIGEWHEDNLHGIAKYEWEDGEDDFIDWGQYKHGKREGYLTQKYSDGRVDYYQCKNNWLNGYGIRTYNDEDVYRGEFIDGNFNGYGLMKYNNGDEYDGQWKLGFSHGEGVFKKASTGRVERRLFEDYEVKEVLEVIEQGH